MRNLFPASIYRKAVKNLSLVCPSEFGKHLTHSAVPRNPGAALLRYPTQGCPLSEGWGTRKGLGSTAGRQAGSWRAEMRKGRLWREGWQQSQPWKEPELA